MLYSRVELCCYFHNRSKHVHIHILLYCRPSLTWLFHKLNSYVPIKNCSTGQSLSYSMVELCCYFHNRSKHVHIHNLLYYRPRLTWLFHNKLNSYWPINNCSTGQSLLYSRVELCCYYHNRAKHVHIHNLL